MKSQVSTPVAVVVIVVVLAIAGFFLWRSQQAKSVPVNDQGIPLVPAESRAEADKMRQMWQSGALRPTAPATGTPSAIPSGPPPPPPGGQPGGAPATPPGP